MANIAAEAEIFEISMDAMTSIGAVGFKEMEDVSVTMEEVTEEVKISAAMIEDAMSIETVIAITVVEAARSTETAETDLET